MRKLLVSRIYQQAKLHFVGKLVIMRGIALIPQASRSSINNIKLKGGPLGLEENNVLEQKIECINSTEYFKNCWIFFITLSFHNFERWIHERHNLMVLPCLTGSPEVQLQKMIRD